MNSPIDKHTDDRLALLRSMSPFAEMDEALIAKICHEMRLLEIEPGAVLVRQNDEATSLFIVASGRFEVVVRDDNGSKERRVDELTRGSIIGEIALIVGGRRSATVRATEHARVLEFSRDRLTRFLEEDAPTVAAFTDMLNARMRRLKTRKPIEDIFGEIDSLAIDKIILTATWVRLQRGEELFRQGDVADGAYIIVSGLLRAAVVSDGSERVIDEVGPGEWVGEMALLAQNNRSATVYAARDSELLWLPNMLFEQLMTQYPKAIFETSRRLVRRLEEQMKSPVKRPKALRVFALVSATPNLRKEEFARDLVAKLECYGSVLHLSSGEVDRRLGVKGISQISGEHPARFRLEPWLLEQEDTYRFIVYETDRDWSHWTERAIRQADHVLVVAESLGDPAPSEIEARMSAQFSGRSSVKQSLVLVHPSGRLRYSGTARWLETRTVDDHHHVRRGSEADVGRLARVLTGNGIALVLGGGGSRGWAHLGAVKACQRLGIPIDAIGGTSMGALVGSVVALGMSAEEILDEVEPVVRRLLDTTLPLVSVAAGKRIVDGLYKIGGGVQIEDLQIPYFAISTNLTRGQQVVHVRGSAAVAVRATTSVPGIFPPVPFQGDLLVDGGLCNNLPVDTMAARHRGPIIAVDVTPSVALSTRAENLPLSLSGWEFVWRKFRSSEGSYDMPNIANVLMRSVSVASHGLQKIAMAEQTAELFLRPPVDEWNLLDFRAAHTSVEQGYRATYPELERWWAGARDERMGLVHHNVNQNDG
jgi:predicted acylesterase/phospholipase RssA/CRP-like cAMP-binding protein